MVEVKASRHCLSTLRNKTSTCCPDTFKVKISRYSINTNFIYCTLRVCAGRYLVFGTIGHCRMHTLGAEHLVFPSSESIIPGIVFPCSRLKCQGTVNTSFIYCTLRVCAREKEYRFISRPLFSGFPRPLFSGFPRPLFFRVPDHCFPGSPDRCFQGFPAVFFPGFPGSGLEKAPERWYSTEMSGARGFRAGPDAEPTVGTP